MFVKLRIQCLPIVPLEGFQEPAPDILPMMSQIHLPPFSQALGHSLSLKRSCRSLKYNSIRIAELCCSVLCRAGPQRLVLGEAVGERACPGMYGVAQGLCDGKRSGAGVGPRVQPWL